MANGALSHYTILLLLKTTSKNVKVHCAHFQKWKPTDRWIDDGGWMGSQQQQQPLQAAAGAEPGEGEGTANGCQAQLNT